MQEGLHTLALWAAVVYGATLAVTGSVLLQPFRRWLARHWIWAGKLVSCPMCFGAWVGGASWLVLPELCPVQGHAWYVAVPSNGFAGCAVCWTLHVLLARLGAEEL